MLTIILCCIAWSVANIPSISQTDKQQHDQVNADPILIEVSWTIHDYDLRTVPTLQVVTNPLLSRQFSPVHKQIFASLKELNAEYARYAVWFPYPKMAVAELDPPSGLFQCGNVGENFSINLSCEQNDGVISIVDFASYGTSSGGCGEMQQGACHAKNSSEIVQRVCVGQKQCSVPATTDLFGDPCKFFESRLKDLFCRERDISNFLGNVSRYEIMNFNSMIVSILTLTYGLSLQFNSDIIPYVVIINRATNELIPL
jgi:hypothetical protein